MQFDVSSRDIPTRIAFVLYDTLRIMPDQLKSEVTLGELRLDSLDLIRLDLELVQAFTLREDGREEAGKKNAYGVTTTFADLCHSIEKKVYGEGNVPSEVLAETTEVLSRIDSHRAV